MKFEVGKKYIRNWGAFPPPPRPCVAVLDGCVYFGPSEPDGYPLCFKLTEVEGHYREYKEPKKVTISLIWVKWESGNISAFVETGQHNYKVGSTHAGSAVVLKVEEHTFGEGSN